MNEQPNLSIGMLWRNGKEFKNTAKAKGKSVYKLLEILVLLK